jgi:hypothetical protein
MDLQICLATIMPFSFNAIFIRQRRSKCDYALPVEMLGVSARHPLAYSDSN